LRAIVKSPTQLEFLSLEEAGSLLGRRQLSAAELLEVALERVERLNPKLNAFITVTAERARRQARAADLEIARNRRRGPLDGIPITLKDNYSTKGVRTTAGSKILQDNIPSEDSAVAARLARAGAVLLGKTNLHEFAYGVTTENPFFGAARNPWALGKTPGGSSGGSAAAVAAGIGFGSMGTDTGGSIRIPASLCGVVGLKPTFGRVSLSGVVPLSESLDHAGPIARSVKDVCILLEATAEAYPPGAKRPDHRKLAKDRPQRFRIGRPKDFYFERVEEEIVLAVEAAINVLKRHGGRVRDVSLPHLSDAMGPCISVTLAEATLYHESQGFFPARAGDYSEDLKSRLEAGSQVSALDYLRAREARREASADFEAAFERVDVIAAPTTPVAAVDIGTREVKIAGETEALRGALLRLTRPANFTGHPALSLPCGFTRAGLPIGLQLIGRRDGEAELLAIADLYETLTDWTKRRPDV
jgi:aspartyl-tRNA(Asn)/glutamyl-tRNA(Gln) amidotransferase subunit A